MVSDEKGHSFVRIKRRARSHEDSHDLERMKLNYSGTVKKKEE